MERSIFLYIFSQFALFFPRITSCVCVFALVLPALRFGVFSILSAVCHRQYVEPAASVQLVSVVVEQTK